MMSTGFSVRRISWKDTNLINICDSEILGTTVSEGKLNMHLSKEYFGGELVGDEEALKLMKSSSIVNLAGQRSVGIAVENRLAAREAIRVVGDIPFLMIYKFFY